MDENRSTLDFPILFHHGPELVLEQEPELVLELEQELALELALEQEL